MRMGAAFTTVLETPGRPDDTDYQLRALRGLYFYHTGSSRYRATLPFARKLHDLAMRGSDPDDRLFGERMMGVTEHFLGDQISARRHLERVLAHYPDHGRDFIRFRTSSASARICEYRRACSLRGCCGCKGFRIRH